MLPGVTDDVVEPRRQWSAVPTPCSAVPDFARSSRIDWRAVRADHASNRRRPSPQLRRANRTHEHVITRVWLARSQTDRALPATHAKSSTPRGGRLASREPPAPNRRCSHSCGSLDRRARKLSRHGLRTTMPGPTHGGPNAFRVARDDGNGDAKDSRSKPDRDRGSAGQPSQATPALVADPPLRRNIFDSPLRGTAVARYRSHLRVPAMWVSDVRAQRLGFPAPRNSVDKQWIARLVHR